MDVARGVRRQPMLLAAALLAAAALPQRTPVPPPPQPSPPPQASIVGRVLDRNGAPIAGVNLAVTRCAPSDNTWEPWKLDAQGRFRYEVPEKFRAQELWVGVRGTFADGEDANAVWSAPVQHVIHLAAGGPEARDAGDLVLDGLDFASRASDEQLESWLRALCGPDRSRYSVRLFTETMLLELPRRSKERWIPVLESLWQYTPPDDDFRGARQVGDLEVLTSLRRLQGKPDPLRIEWLAQAPVTVEAFGVLELPVRLANHDVEQVCFDLQHGGDYRSGRLERWTIEAVDDAQRLHPPAVYLCFMGGGMSSTHAFGPGEEFPARLVLHHYVAPLPPGRYRLRASYHDQEEIAPPKNAAWRVVSTSDELELRVTPRRIAIERALRDALKREFDALDPQAPVLLFDSGTAGKRVAIPSPSTSEERLLAAGWQAVPVLLDALLEEATPAGRRAWALALLYDVTGIENPLAEPHALGSHRFVFGRSEEGSDTVVLGGGGVATATRPPDPRAQARLVERWRSLRGLIEVEVR